jgi:hypothetical protein
MFRKEKPQAQGMKPAPVTDEIDRVINASTKPADPACKSTYVEKRLEQAKSVMRVKQTEMTQLQGEMQVVFNEVSLLQKLRDGSVGVYVTDILDMIDEYRLKDFEDQAQLLEAFEKEIINIATQNLGG